MRRPRRTTPSRRQLALAAAGQAPLRAERAANGIREADPLTAHALDLSHWLDTGEGERGLSGKGGGDGEG